MDIERMQPLTNGELREVRRQLALDPPRIQAEIDEEDTLCGSWWLAVLVFLGVGSLIGTLSVATAEVLWDWLGEG